MRHDGAHGDRGGERPSHCGALPAGGQDRPRRDGDRVARHRPAPRSAGGGQGAGPRRLAPGGSVPPAARAHPAGGARGRPAQPPAHHRRARRRRAGRTPVHRHGVDRRRLARGADRGPAGPSTRGEAARIGIALLGALRRGARRRGAAPRSQTGERPAGDRHRPGRPHRLRHRPGRRRDHAHRERVLRRLARVHRAGADVRGPHRAGVRPVVAGRAVVCRAQRGVAVPAGLAWAASCTRSSSTRSGRPRRPRRCSPSYGGCWSAIRTGGSTRRRRSGCCGPSGRPGAHRGRRRSRGRRPGTPRPGGTCHARAGRAAHGRCRSRRPGRVGSRAAAVGATRSRRGVGPAGAARAAGAAAFHPERTGRRRAGGGDGRGGRVGGGAADAGRKRRRWWRHAEQFGTADAGRVAYDGCADPLGRVRPVRRRVRHVGGRHTRHVDGRHAGYVGRRHAHRHTPRAATAPTAPSGYRLAEDPTGLHASPCRTTSRGSRRGSGSSTCRRGRPSASASSSTTRRRAGRLGVMRARPCEGALHEPRLPRRPGRRDHARRAARRALGVHLGRLQRGGGAPAHVRPVLGAGRAAVRRVGVGAGREGERGEGVLRRGGGHVRS